MRPPECTTSRSSSRSTTRRRTSLGLHRELAAAGDGLGRSFEIIFVDDGSRDGSFAALRRLQASDPRVKVVRLRRNFGQTAALSAGFDHARGQIIVTLDADLQNDPADIGLLLAKIDEGYDVVSGWRKNRKDKLVFTGGCRPRRPTG